MSFKDFIHSKVGFVLISFLAAAVVGSLLVVAALFYLDSYTRHGDEVQVPDVRTMYVPEAQMLVQEQSLSIEVIDSTYSRKVPGGTILEQQPAPGANTKRDRVIYVVVNARQQRPVEIPNMKDVSLRQVESSIHALGLVVDTVIYQHSIYKDLVLDVRKDGISLEPGTRVPEGTRLTLMVGDGEGQTEWDEETGEQEEDEFF